MLPGASFVRPTVPAGRVAVGRHELCRSRDERNVAVSHLSDTRNVAPAASPLYRARPGQRDDGGGLPKVRLDTLKPIMGGDHPSKHGIYESRTRVSPSRCAVRP